MLSARSSAILNYIVGEYIARVAPVPSQYIADTAEMGVSPATIRNEMAYLEAEGYICRPHLSAGAVPIDKGYRHYVESLSKNIELPLEEQNRIRDSFHNIEEETWKPLPGWLFVQSS